MTEPYHPFQTDIGYYADRAEGRRSYAEGRCRSSRRAISSRGNDMGWTPLHQAAYGNSAEGVRLLLGFGGRVEGSARGEGGTPLVVALFWGHREASTVLAEHGTPPGNLRVAAGLRATGR